jgi:hypothetical protein
MAGEEIADLKHLDARLKAMKAELKAAVAGLVDRANGPACWNQPMP